MQQIAGYGLTDAQQNLFREGTESLFSFAPSDGQRAARQAVIDEVGGERGQHIAELIERSARTRDDTELRLIGNYNSQGQSPEKKTDGLRLGAAGGIGATTGEPGGRILDVIAAAESQGNYNAWYGNAGQSEVDLSRMTVDQVRDLQRDLVRRNGGSAIGRYQILDDTLDDLQVRMGLTGSERFTPELQDRMGLLLAQDAGFDSWRRGILPDEQFANNLSRIWAGLPQDASNTSYHEGIAGNHATVDFTFVMGALQKIRRST